MGFIPGPNDPFYELMQPPADETPAQATARLKREQDAQRVNDMIDEGIKQERAQAKKGRNLVKVLLLGQSESGA
jgi:guanine nucleotide-binding protein subunit alpha